MMKIPIKLINIHIHTCSSWRWYPLNSYTWLHIHMYVHIQTHISPLMMNGKIFSNTHVAQQPMPHVSFFTHEMGCGTDWATWLFAKRFSRTRNFLIIYVRVRPSWIRIYKYPHWWSFLFKFVYDKLLH